MSSFSSTRSRRPPAPRTPTASGTRSTATWSTTGRPQSFLRSTGTLAARSSQEILDRYEDGRLFAHEPQADRIGERAAHTETFRIGEVLPGHVIPHDAGRDGEVIFWVAPHRALVVGDAILGAEDGVRLSPSTPGETLRPLLRSEIDLLLLTHGGPVLEDARGALERALSD